ncbi:MAG: hypothetical protein IK114_08820 [Fibrobacter sp.]|nr:hypothetical protein [Fibrobacter sp.]
MFYKHWKKLALALTGFFWASCDFGSSSSEEAALYGCPPEGCEPNPAISSSSTEGNLSSSATETSSSSEEQKPVSSSEDFGKVVPLYGIEYEKFVSSSSAEESSSSFTEIMPAYGVLDKIACIQKPGEKTMLCDDGVTCKQVTEERWAPENPCVDEICPDYGVVQISENTYECDGVKYNEAEFHARYKKITEAENSEQDSSFQGEIQPALYGPPCVFNGTCDDAEK